MKEVFFEEKKITQNDINELDFKDFYEFENCIFDNIDFKNFNFSHAKITDSEFLYCNLSNKDLKNLKIGNCQFAHSKLLGINWSELKNLNEVSFFECVLDYSRFVGMNLKKSKFIKCGLKEVEFLDSNMSECDFSASDLLGAQFQNVDLRLANFRQAKNYSFDLNTVKLTKAKFSIPEVLSLLHNLEIEID